MLEGAQQSILFGINIRIGFVSYIASILNLPLNSWRGEIMVVHRYLGGIIRPRIVCAAVKKYTPFIMNLEQRPFLMLGS